MNPFFDETKMNRVIHLEKKYKEFIYVSAGNLSQVDPVSAHSVFFCYKFVSLKNGSRRIDINPTLIDTATFIDIHQPLLINCNFHRYPTTFIDKLQLSLIHRNFIDTSQLHWYTATIIDPLQHSFNVLPHSLIQCNHYWLIH